MQVGWIRKIMFFSAVVLIGRLMLSPAVAADNNPGVVTQPNANEAQSTQQSTTGTTTSVNKTQLELAAKREEARKRRDAMIEMRAATIRSAQQAAR